VSSINITIKLRISKESHIIHVKEHVCVCDVIEQVERWTEPTPKSIKRNVDATIFIDQGGFEVGICLSEYQGELICVKVSSYYGLPPPREA